MQNVGHGSDELGARIREQESRELGRGSYLRVALLDRSQLPV
jgi:hypothetical protein